MSRDNWARLVEATVKREELRRLAFCQSFSTCSSVDDSSSRFSLDSTDFEADRISTETTIPKPSSGQNLTSRLVEFKEIKKATKNFHPELILGEGAFACVYKGWIHEFNMTAAKPGSGLTVAVKKLNLKGYGGLEEWLNEIKFNNELQHPNLVKLIAPCSEEDELILVYEFIPNGSLDNHLFKKEYHESLSWATRMKVATGASRALSFLHNMEIQVIHRNFIPSNLLLDGEYNAKLNGFSLAINGPIGDMTYVSTRVIGTSGYAAPEYMSTGHLTAKSDVYGFGVVLLELLTGRRALGNSRSLQFIVEWVQPYLLQKRRLKKIMGTKLEGQYPEEEADIVATLASQCLRRDPTERPTMAEVLLALEKL